MTHRKTSPHSRTSFKKPPALHPGDTIALLAPASPPINPDNIDKAISALENRGFAVSLGRSARTRNGFVAGTDKDRLRDLVGAFSNPKVKAILCLRGGYGSGRILSKIDFLKISKTPKIFVGCSDLTALLTCFNSKSKITTFHGPVLQGLIDKDCPQFTWDSLFSQLSGDDSALGSICHNYNLKDKTVEVLFKGKATGQLIGGNLAVLCSLLGTSFFPKLDGKILLFEDIGELPFRLDRALTQLTNAGVLNKVAGFALGLFKDCEYRAPKEGEVVEKKQSVNDVFCERLKQFRKPIISGLPFGHLPHNATLPIGSLVTLDGGRGDLIIEEIGVNRQRGSHPQR